MSKSVQTCETCGGLSGVSPSIIAGEKHYFNSLACKDEWVNKRIEELEAEVKRLKYFVDQCHTLTGSLWPQNETTEELGRAIKELKQQEAGDE